MVATTAIPQNDVVTIKNMTTSNTTNNALRKSPPPPPSLALVDMASLELERLRNSNNNKINPDAKKKENQYVKTECFFPKACGALLYHIQGNDKCVDCGALHPQWASVTYGTLLCLDCAGKHRRMGVQTSYVRSIHMDTWTHGQILSMLEGGNGQLHGFFDRHALTSKRAANDDMSRDDDEVCTFRYQTRAAEFYRVHLEKHVKQVLDSGRYKGRTKSRRQNRSRNKGHAR